VLRRLAAALALGCVAAAGAAGQDLPWKLKDLGRLDGLVDLHAVPGSDVIVAATAAGTVGLRFGPDGSLRRVGVPQQPEPPPDLLPHSRCAVGAADIRLACLTGPTEGYDHGVLGDAVEAKALSVRRGDGAWSRHRLAGDAVFEDRTPRLADLDGDGRDEVIVVKAAPGQGAALAVLGLDGLDLRPRSESQPIGLSYRWLNPVGAGDFDGDGRVEVAVVRTPHIGGILMIYRPDGPRLVVEGRLRGFSNHRMGSTALGLAAVADFDGDGLVDILLPRQDRSRLAVMSYAGGTFREVAAAALDAPVETSMVLADGDGNDRPDVVFGLADGRLVGLMR